MFWYLFPIAMLILLFCAEVLRRGEERSKKECDRVFYENRTSAEIEKNIQKTKHFERRNPDIYFSNFWNQILRSDDKYKTMNSDFVVVGSESECYGCIGVEKDRDRYKLHIKIYCHCKDKIRDHHMLSLSGIGGSVLPEYDQVMSCQFGNNASIYNNMTAGCFINKEGEIKIKHLEPSQVETDFYHIEGYIIAAKTPVFAEYE